MRWGLAVSAMGQTGQSDAIHSPEACASVVVRLTIPAVWSMAWSARSQSHPPRSHGRPAGEPVPMISDGFCDQGLPGDCMVGVTTVVFERGVGVVIVVTLPVPWMACLRVYALVV